MPKKVKQGVVVSDKMDKTIVVFVCFNNFLIFWVWIV